MLILPALLIPLKDQFGASITQITSLGTICYFLYGFMALPGGFLADKLGYRVVLTMFFVGTPAAACVVGSARSMLGLGIGLGLLGFFASFYHPSGLAMISHGVRERGKALGLHGMCGNLGLAFSPVVAGGLASIFSWRYAYYFLSLPGFLAGVIFLILSRASITVEQPETSSSQKPGQSTPDQPVQRSKVWAVVFLYIAMALSGFCYRGVITMLPTYLGRVSISSELQPDLDSTSISGNLQQEFEGKKIQLSQDAVVSVRRPGVKWEIKDADKTYTVMKEKNTLNVYGRRATKGDIYDRGNLFATMVLLIGMVGQYMGGHYSDRRRKTRLYLLFNAVSLPFLFLVGLTPGTLVLVVAALFALFHFANQPVENSLIAHYTPSRLRSRGYGLKFFLTFGLGAFASGFSGYVVDRFGFNSVFLALGGVLTLLIVSVVFLNLTAKEERVGTSE